MRIIAVISCLLIFYGCGKQEEECQITDEGYFYLESLHTEFSKRDFRPTLDATIMEMPFTGTTGLLILQDEKGDNYQ